MKLPFYPHNRFCGHAPIWTRTFLAYRPSPIPPVKGVWKILGNMRMQSPIKSDQYRSKLEITLDKGHKMLGRVNLAIADFEEISRKMAMIAEAESIEARKDIIAIRKANLAAMETLRQAVEALIKGTPAARTELEKELSARFQAMHRVVILHQGKWPAVLIAGDPHGFVASARSARMAKTDFLDWLRRELFPKLTTRASSQS